MINTGSSPSLWWGARDVPKAAQMVEDWECRVINYCKSKEFTIEGLKERWMAPRHTWLPQR